MPLSIVYTTQFNNCKLSCRRRSRSSFASLVTRTSIWCYQLSVDTRNIMFPDTTNNVVTVWRTTSKSKADLLDKNWFRCENILHTFRACLNGWIVDNINHGTVSLSTQTCQKHRHFQIQLKSYRFTVHYIYTDQQSYHIPRIIFLQLRACVLLL